MSQAATGSVGRSDPLDRRDRHPQPHLPGREERRRSPSRPPAARLRLARRADAGRRRDHGGEGAGAAGLHAAASPADAVVREVVVATMPESKAAAQLEAHPQVVLEEDHLSSRCRCPPRCRDAVEPAPRSSARSARRSSGRSSSSRPPATPLPVPPSTSTAAASRRRASATPPGASPSACSTRPTRPWGALRQPAAHLWSLWVNRPALISGIVNTVTLSPLSQTFAGFPASSCSAGARRRWASITCRRRTTARTIRVAVIDSGATVARIPTFARSCRARLTNSPSNTVPGATTLAHGSHCSGVIAGPTTPAGCAASPRPPRCTRRASSRAADQQPHRRPRLLHRPADRRREHEPRHGRLVADPAAEAGPGPQQGVACIVAAGNSGDAGPVPRPSPDVLTVSAIGQDGSSPTPATTPSSAGPRDGGPAASSQPVLLPRPRGRRVRSGRRDRVVGAAGGLRRVGRHLDGRRRT